MNIKEGTAIEGRGRDARHNRLVGTFWRGHREEATLNLSYEILLSPPHCHSLPPVCALFWGSRRTWFGTLSYEEAEEVGKQCHFSFCRLGHNYAMTIIAWSYLNLLCLNKPSIRAVETMTPFPSLWALKLTEAFTMISDNDETNW